MQEPLIREEAALRALIAAAFVEPADRPAITLRAGKCAGRLRAASAVGSSARYARRGVSRGQLLGQHHLDPASWRYYLPILMRHGLDRFRGRAPSMSTDTLPFSLRPPDRDPPRFATLSPEQNAAVSQFLDLLAFDPRSMHTDDAMTAMEEYWAPGATYR